MDERRPIRVLAVDDEGLFRDLILRVFDGAEMLEVVGAANDGESAVLMSRELQPDVVIMDVKMPGTLNGIQAAVEIKKERPETGIVVLTGHMEPQYLQRATTDRESGWSYLLKQSLANTEALIRAVEGCAHGLVVLDPEIASDVRPTSHSRLANLTPRQLEVLTYIAQGYNNSAIAAKMNLGEKTVQNYNNAIFQELRLSGETAVHARVRAALIYAEESLGR